jgi:hypothetical protein
MFIHIDRQDGQDGQDEQRTKMIVSFIPPILSIRVKLFFFGCGFVAFAEVKK